jgi:hypothetical protein
LEKLKIIAFNASGIAPMRMVAALVGLFFTVTGVKMSGYKPFTALEAIG